MVVAVGDVTSSQASLALQPCMPSHLLDPEEEAERASFFVTQIRQHTRFSDSASISLPTQSLQHSRLVNGGRTWVPGEPQTPASRANDAGACAAGTHPDVCANVTFDWQDGNLTLDTCELAWDPWRLEESISRCV